MRYTRRAVIAIAVAVVCAGTPALGQSGGSGNSGRPGGPIGKGGSGQGGQFSDLPTLAPFRIPTIEAPVTEFGGPLKFDRKQLIQRTVPGTNAGASLGASLSSGEKPSPEVAAILALLSSPDSSKPASKAQVECDGKLSAAEARFASWKSSNKPNGVPVSLEDFPVWYRNSSTPAEKQRASTVTAALDDAMTTCFSTAPPEGFQPTLQVAIGALTLSNGTPFCSVYRVEADVVATARHCVEPSGIRMSPGQLRKLLVRLPGLAQAPFSIVDFAKVEGATSRSIKNDWVLLRTQALPGGVSPDSKPFQGSITVGSRLLIGGLLLRSEDGLGSEAMRYSGLLSCVVIYSSDACVTHTCNTFPGFSGAPIFVEAGGRWHWLAVHSRAVVPLDLQESCKPPKAMPADSRLNAGFLASRLP